MLSQQNLTSQAPMGVVSTLAALRAIDTTTVSDFTTVTVLGSGVAGDGFGGSYYWDGGSLASDDAGNIALAAGTGRWTKVNPFSGISVTATYTGARESFVLMSGIVNTMVYQLPPSNTNNGGVIRFKQLGTGAVSIRPTSPDLIFDSTGLAAQVNFQLSGGKSYTLQCLGSVYYTI